MPRLESRAPSPPGCERSKARTSNTIPPMTTRCAPFIFLVDDSTFSHRAQRQDLQRVIRAHQQHRGRQQVRGSGCWRQQGVFLLRIPLGERRVVSHQLGVNAGNRRWQSPPGNRILAATKAGRCARASRSQTTGPGSNVGPPSAPPSFFWATPARLASARSSRTSNVLPGSTSSRTRGVSRVEVPILWLGQGA